MSISSVPICTKINILVAADPHSYLIEKNYLCLINYFNRYKTIGIEVLNVIIKVLSIAIFVFSFKNVYPGLLKLQSFNETIK